MFGVWLVELVRSGALHDVGTAHREACLALEEADHGVVLSEVTVPLAMLGVRRGSTAVTSHLLRVRNPAGISADCGDVIAPSLHSLEREE